VIDANVAVLLNVLAPLHEFVPDREGTENDSLVASIVVLAIFVPVMTPAPINVVLLIAPLAIFVDPTADVESWFVPTAPFAI